MHTPADGRQVAADLRGAADDGGAAPPAGDRQGGARGPGAEGGGEEGPGHPRAEPRGLQEGASRNTTYAKGV